MLSLWRAEIARVLPFLRDGGVIPDTYWGEFEERQRDVLRPWVERLAQRGVNQGRRELEKAKSIVDWNLINQTAADWARNYLYDLVGGITDTTRTRLQEAVGEWIESGAPFAELHKRVIEIFDDPRRAELIAVTETTRVINEANMIAWQANDVWGREWRTAVDDIVCEICGPLHLQRRPMGEGFQIKIGGAVEVIQNPPAHPNCRCGLVPVVINE